MYRNKELKEYELAKFIVNTNRKHSSSYPEAKFVGDFGPTPYEIHVNSQSQK